MSLVARHCWVSGRVQGVYYRASTCQQARELGVTGYARNLSDGRVEVHAEGAVQAVEALCEWLWAGPPAARVQAVECHNIEPVGYQDFVTQ